MIKTYEAPYTTIINLTLFLEDGVRAKISFHPISESAGSRTGRGSMFQTDDERIQKALENHGYFGTTIRLFSQEKTKEEIAAEEAAKEKPVYEHVEVSTPDDARDYLEEKFGVERKTVTTIKKIKDVALKNGVIFDGI